MENLVFGGGGGGGLALTLAATAAIWLVQPQSSWAKFQEAGSLPEFTSRILNHSVPIGRDVTFTCNVKNLGNFKVGWVKADSKTIQAIHDAVITHNARISVSGDLYTTFNLHIAAAEEKDRGQYMCQINTDPMTYQIAYLDVMVPPDIIQSTPDLELQQGETANLQCRADGYPTPNISWRREDEQMIKAKDAKTGNTRQYRRYSGPSLTIPKVSPDDMGAYLCIAENMVPPAQSKRVFVYVQFAPKVRAPKKLIGAAYGGRALLRCEVQAFPRPIVYWNHTRAGMIVSGGRHKVTEAHASPFEVASTLAVSHADTEDEGQYTCIAKNSLDEAQAVVRLYMVATPAPPPTTTTTAPVYYESLDDDGSDDNGGSSSHTEEFGKLYKYIDEEGNAVSGGGGENVGRDGSHNFYGVLADDVRGGIKKGGGGSKRRRGRRKKKQEQRINSVLTASGSSTTQTSGLLLLTMVSACLAESAISSCCSL